MIGLSSRGSRPWLTTAAPPGLIPFWRRTTSESHSSNIMLLDNLSILVTGGTGSFGKKFAEVVLREHKPRRLIVYSRDELKQHEMRTGGFDHPSLRFFLGDV